MKQQPSRLARRRTFLAGTATTAAAMLLRPVLSAAQTAQAPARLLVVHRPCGTRLERWFPSGGTATNFALPPILESFAALKDEMVILNQISCPRVQEWAGDKHGAGLISMMTGRRAMVIPGTKDPTSNEDQNLTAAEPTFDQFLLSKAARLQGTPVPSVQLTASKDSASRMELPCLRVVSYGAANSPMYPENRPETAFDNVFGRLMPGATPQALARVRQRQQSILDFVRKDLTSLRGRVPKEQLSKLDSHLEGVRQIELKLSTPENMAMCTKPTLQSLPMASPGVTDDEAHYALTSREQLQIIKTAFQCDLTRVASFTFGHGNSALRFSNIVSGALPLTGGHHDISHDGSDQAKDVQATIDKYACDRLAEVMLDMKNTPDVNGTSLLDNTLVVFFNECSNGADHALDDMPVLMFGAKTLGLRRGSNLRFGGKRYMTDVWASVAGAFGAPIVRFGDPAWGSGALSGLFG